MSIPFEQLRRACPICESVTAEPLQREDFVLPQGHPLHEGYWVVACERCGLVYADTVATQADYDYFYENFSKYDNVATSTGGGGTALDAQRLQETAKTVAALLPDHNCRILDVGCAAGGLLHELKKLGYGNLCGLDPSAVAVRYGRDHFGLEMRQGSLFSHPDIAPADGIILSHVIEHIHDLRSAMQAVHRLVATDGLFFVEVPDAQHYKDHLVAPYQDFNTEHINHFGRASLTSLLDQSGFEVTEMQEKTIKVAAGTGYPALYACCRKRVPRPVSYQPDPDFRRSIDSYIAASAKMLDAMDRRLAAALTVHPRVDVWGAGQLTYKLLTATCLAQADIRCFVDNNPAYWGKLLRGVPIVEPAQWMADPLPVVIATALHQDTIVKDIRARMKQQVELITLSA